MYPTVTALSHLPTLRMSLAVISVYQRQPFPLRANGLFELFLFILLRIAQQASLLLLSYTSLSFVFVHRSSRNDMIGKHENEKGENQNDKKEIKTKGFLIRTDELRRRLQLIKYPSSTRVYERCCDISAITQTQPAYFRIFISTSTPFIVRC